MRLVLHRRRTRLIVAGLLLSSSCAVPASAAPDIAPWRAELPVYLTAILHYRGTDDSHDSRAIASILAELRLRHADRPWSIGPVVEVHRNVTGRDDTAVGAGIIFRHAHEHWDTTALVFRHMPLHAPDAWNYAARLRYRVSPTGKLGAEVYGAVDSMESSDLMVGWYGDITRTLSIRLLAGTTIDRSDARLARIDVVLQLN
ncbi:MAG: hypothetical protein R3288_10725 [Woeseiaceae bacterium]|nr:hypothetical protein [Woeseiaceae bacterium]